MTPQVRMLLPHRLGRLAAALVLGSVVTAPAAAQERRAEVTATYLGVTRPAIQVAPAAGAQPAAVPSKNTFRYTWKGEDKWAARTGRPANPAPAPLAPAMVAVGDGPSVGMLNWEVPPDQFTTAGLDRAFRTFCAEAGVRIVAGNTYRFEMLMPATPVAFGLPDDDAGRAEAFRRSTYIRELFGRYYVQAVNDAEAAKAFQIALWEIIHETPVDGEEDEVATFDLNAGDFRSAENPAEVAFVPVAQNYLTSLTGNDNVFWENPALAGRELVWMRGVPSPLAANAVAQSQFALQYVRGGAPGAAGAAVGGPGLVGPGGVPIGAGPGGIGPGFGGGGAPFGFAQANPSNPPANTPPTNPPVNNPPGNPPVNVPPVNTPPVNQPPGGEEFPPSQPPDIPVPIPGPPGLILGLIAVGALAGRRAFGQLLRRK